MDVQISRISDARRRVTVMASIARWLWVVNSLVALSGALRGRFDIAALAGFTWILSLVVAAFGNRAAQYLASIERTINSS